MISLIDYHLSLFITASILLNLFFLCRSRRTPSVTKPKLRSLVGERALHTRQYFYVGGTQVPHGSSTIHHGQMYVEHLTPARVSRRIPLVLIHGNGMTGTNWLNTPDGRPGWSDYFLNEGYEVMSAPRVARASHNASFRCTSSTNPLGDALHASLKLMAPRIPLVHGRSSHDLRPRQSTSFGHRLPCTHSGPEVDPRVTRSSMPFIILSYLVLLPQSRLLSS